MGDARWRKSAVSSAGHSDGQFHGPLWAFLPLLPWELTEQRKPLRGERTAGTKKYGTSLQQLCLPTLPLRPPPSGGKHGPSDLRGFDLTTHSPACSLTSAPLTGPTGAAALRTPNQPLRWPLAPACTAVPPTPPLYSGTCQGKKRAGGCLHPQRTNKARMPTSETRE